MNKYGKIYIGYEPGSEDWVTKNGEYEVVEVEAKNYPEDTDSWDTIFGYEMVDTIVEAGQKLIKETGYADLIANCLCNIYWQKIKYQEPMECYDKKKLLVVVYDKYTQEFSTTVDVWDAKEKRFVLYKHDVVYWAELPAPPNQV